MFLVLILDVEMVELIGELNHTWRLSVTLLFSLDVCYYTRALLLGGIDLSAVVRFVLFECAPKQQLRAQGTLRALGTEYWL